MLSLMKRHQLGRHAQRLAYWIILALTLALFGGVIVLTGTVVPYNQTDTISDVLAVPGDLGSATETTTGENIYRPADGAPVFVNAGRTVFALDGTLEFRAGPQSFLDYFVDGDTAAIDALCSALRAA